VKDIDIARKHLDEKGVRIAVVKEGKLIYKSDERGIKPMYTLAMKLKDGLSNASVADRVIGKGAAILCKHMGVREVHGRLMSDNAIELLRGSNIQFTYEEKCAYIENEDRTGLCPIEKLSIDIEDGDVLLRRIGEFIKG